MCIRDRLVLGAMSHKGKKSSEILNCFKPAPQIKKNIRYNGTSPLANKEIAKQVEEVKKSLEENGARLVVRTSGTEPLVRLMAEGDDIDYLEKTIEDLAKLITTGK